MRTFHKTELSTRAPGASARRGDPSLGLRGLIGVTQWIPILILLSTGCMRPAGEIFPAIDPPLVWPLPPDPPRIAYVGELRSSADLRPAKSGWQRFREALGSPETRPIPLTTPHAVAIGEDGRIYVADTGSACLHVIDLARRTHVRTRAAGEVSADERAAGFSPRGLTDSVVRVSHIDAQRRLKPAARGDSRGADYLRSPVGVTVGGSSVFVTDAVLGDVFEYGLDGVYKRRLGVSLERPGGIAYCPDNQRLYVVDTGAHSCVSLREDGEVLFSFGERGSQPGMFNFPTHITCSPLLGLIVSDTLGFRVQRFELDGTFVAEIGGKGDGAGDFSLPKGVAVDSDGNLYVVDAHFENVQIFRADGRLLLAFGEEGTGRGQFSIPSGIAIDRHDRIWIADSHNRRLQVFRYLSDRRS